ncbi:TetR/AcrR family transcriptional regulator [Streptomyces phaeolivaceus]|uniref:TetR/AcrR family transcriptional regulator n=1 Tax=Streptomyces phaeolivaceus TaxID=2653200 RepID=UPI00186A1FB3|nr:TetR/AcrR family transcriptional regulator [Streptomyces phaeolivaceus]
MSDVQGRRDGQAGSSGSARRRRYRSALRDERAADTRGRIAAAARELFATRGFAGTTVALIAEHAGVATPTVYAVFSSKGEIMRELVSRLETEADGEDWRARIEAEPDPRRKLEWYAAWHRTLFATGRDVLAAALNAGGDPAVLDLREQGDRNAQAWLEPIIDALAAADMLAPGLTQQQAVDRGLMLSSLELYFRATNGRGWSDEAYQQWLTELLHHQLLVTPGVPDGKN